MHSETPKSRFKIRPGTSARSAEEERNSKDVFPQMRIQGGTSARLAEADARAARGPLSIRWQARAGEALAPASLRSADAAHAESYHGKESAQQKPATGDKSSRSAIRDSSRQPAEAPERLSNPATKVVEVKKGFSLARGEEKNSTTPTSPLKKLRALFLRKVPKTGTPD